MNNITTKKNKIKYILLFVVLVIFVFALVFSLYDSPAKYVTKPDGSIYLDDKGEPILYYKDLFGFEFYQDSGKRDYAAVPDYKSDTVIYNPVEITTDNNN